MIPTQIRGCGSVLSLSKNRTRAFASANALGLAGREASLLQDLLDLVERLLAEVAHLDDLVFRHVEQLGHLGDAGALEAVERADRQVQRLDRHVPLTGGGGGDGVSPGGATGDTRSSCW